MTDIPNSQGPQPDLWNEFDAVEAQAAAEQEAAFQKIEGYNRIILNNVAGLETSDLTLVDKLSEGPHGSELPGEVLKLDVQRSLLYLQPDTRGKLARTGELEIDARGGDPHVIAGEIPPRSQQLIDDLLAGIEAAKDEEHSTPGLELWNGKVGGIQDVTLEFHHQISKIITGDTVDEKPVLFIWAQRTSESPGDTVGSTPVSSVTAGVQDANVKKDYDQQVEPEKIDERMAEGIVKKPERSAARRRLQNFTRRFKRGKY